MFRGPHTQAHSLITLRNTRLSLPESEILASPNCVLFSFAVSARLYRVLQLLLAVVRSCIRGWHPIRVHIFAWGAHKGEAMTLFATVSLYAEQ
jgi:hypothetical protein